MGIDIYLYRDLKKVENPVFDCDGDCTSNPDAISFYENPDFPGRMDGIEPRPTFYDSGEVDSVLSMGYGRYNGWREQLAKFAGYPTARVERYGQVEHRHDQAAFEAAGGPFWELICFSDCEGAIGPVAAAKLAVDFASNLHRLDEFEGNHDAYKSMQAALEVVGAGNAALRFT